MAGLWRADDGFDHWRHYRSLISTGIGLIPVYLVAFWGVGGFCFIALPVVYLIDIRPRKRKENKTGNVKINKV